MKFSFVAYLNFYFLISFFLLCKIDGQNDNSDNMSNQEYEKNKFSQNSNIDNFNKKQREANIVIQTLNDGKSNTCELLRNPISFVQGKMCGCKYAVNLYRIILSIEVINLFQHYQKN
jgi:hypothetical protein